VIVPNSIGEAYALLQSIGKRAWHLPRWCAIWETSRLVFLTVAPLSSNINDLFHYSVQVSCMTLDMAPSIICLSPWTSVCISLFGIVWLHLSFCNGYHLPSKFTCSCLNFF
jgi:hypothetical protein